MCHRHPRCCGAGLRSFVVPGEVVKPPDQVELGGNPLVRPVSGLDSGVGPLFPCLFPPFCFPFFFLSSFSLSRFHSLHWFHFIFISIASARAFFHVLARHVEFWDEFFFFFCKFSFSDDPGDYDRDGAGLYR
ncbi:hypothetical protein BDW42DRAFT_4169 [Aspergillus taichungensis]|uniref:Uncharacterized protein n=1 Tax=Aspergillus taichungensis TaxID=482145 RepID=A0A2J5HJX1_9EURO|nr:hypothetical protein BDW42DRAFT_4169 [Aspergillus taichungensis]